MNYGRNDRLTCIVCGERDGSIRTADGMVCRSCMPYDLLEDAEKIGKNRILGYCRTYPDWVSCDGRGVYIVDRKIEDRSAAITTFTPSTLDDELNAQIAESESIDVVVSFIKLSGLSLLMDTLRDFTCNGKLRVITTSYMGATEYAALDELFSLPNTEVRMELDAKESRLHAKSFIFNRCDGTSVAFVGSANISKSALTDGEEWVVKLYDRDVPQVIKELKDSFECLWTSRGIKPVTRKNRAEIERAIDSRGK